MYFLNSSVGNCDFNALSELRNLKSRIEELESEIRERDEEVRVLKENAQQKLINGDDSDLSKVKFEHIKVISINIFRQKTKYIYKAITTYPISIEDKDNKNECQEEITTISLFYILEFSNGERDVE